MKNIKHIFFDLDNTLWDYRKNAFVTLQNLYEEFEIKKNYGFSFDQFYPHYYESNETLWADFRDQKVTKEELRARRFPEAFANLGVAKAPFAMEFELRFVDEVTNTHHLVDNAIEILEYLKPKYQLHILSNGFTDVTFNKINGSPIKNYIETVTTAESAGAPKPSPIAFQASLDAANAQKEESAYIGDDWIADVLGSTDFGMKAVFFNPLEEKHDWIDGVSIIDDLDLLRNIF